MTGAQLDVGHTLPVLRQVVTTTQLFRFSATTWNPHRIHFDAEYADREGHPGLVVHSHLRAALALRAVTEGLGPEWAIRSVDYRLRRPAICPVELEYSATVRSAAGDGFVLDLFEQQGGQPAGLEGTVTVYLNHWS